MHTHTPICALEASKTRQMVRGWPPSFTYPGHLPETHQFFGYSGASLKDLRPPHTILMGPTLIPNLLPSSPRQLSFLWQEGRVPECLVSSLSDFLL